MSSISFPEFLQRSLQQGPTNLIFEHGMYLLWQDLERLLQVFETAAVPFAMLGGVAVNAHLLAASQRSRCFVAHDLKVLVRPPDLSAIEAAANHLGYEPKRRGRAYTLPLPDRALWEAVHFLFAGEKLRSTDPVVIPELAPEWRELWGTMIPLVPIRDVVITMLNSGHALDLVYLEILESAARKCAATAATVPKYTMIATDFSIRYRNSRATSK